MKQIEPIALELASRLNTLRLEDMSSKSKNIGVSLIADTIGAALLGTRDVPHQVLRTAMAGQLAPGNALVWGTRQRVGTLDAAMLNGFAAHAADYDDMAASMAGGGHPSAPLVPVLFALGAELGATGNNVLEAYIVGFEAECRIGRIVHWPHYEKGWHPTSTLGVFGAAVSAAHLMKLDVPQTATAISICASLASGVKANFGTMTKPLHVGQCARNGLFAARLAAAGHTANLSAIEHPQGFLAAFNGLDKAFPERLWDGWGEILEVERHAVGAKQFPCCGSTHAAIRGAIQLRKEGLNVREIEEIKITVNRRRLPHTNNPNPQTGLAGKFSAQYVVARALSEGAVRIDDFDHFNLTPQVKDLMEKVRLDSFPPADLDESGDEINAWAATVEIRTHDGAIRSTSVPSLLGRGATDPMSPAEQWEKFSDCTRGVLTPTGSYQTFAHLQNLQSCDSIEDICNVLESQSIDQISA